MKTFIYSLLFTSSLANLSYAQEAKFYVNKSATVATNCDCPNTSTIKVTFPVPANVGSYDLYQFYINLSSLDVPATIGFDKAEIAAKLAGKKEFTAYLLKEDGSSDFYFEDVYLEKRDLCSSPRMWGMTEMEMEAGSAGYKVIGFHYEDTWNEYYKRWDSKKFEDWDEGVAYSSGSLIIKQTPLSEGFSDLTEIINVKTQNTDSCSYSVSENIDEKGSLSIQDNSQDFQATITYAIWGGGEETYNAVKESVIISLSGKFQVGPVHNFNQLEGMQTGVEKKINDKSSSFSTVTFNGISYETVSHCRTKTGFYATFYITRFGEYTVLIVSITNEIYEMKRKGNSLMDGEELVYQFELTDENIKQVDAINEKWLTATTYNIPQ